MYFSKQQIADKVRQISEVRHSYDEKVSDLQRMIKQSQKYQVVELRSKFASGIAELQLIVKDNQTVLDLLMYRCQKLSKQGVELNSQKIRIQSLKQYFTDLKQRVKRQNQKGEDVISGIQRWELTKNHGEQIHHDQEQTLLNSHSVARQTTQIARGVFESLANQGGRLENARQKMGNVLKNINFSGNLAQLLKTRTREDNKLIGILSFGLFLWIMLCLLILKPWYRGT